MVDNKKYLPEIGNLYTETLNELYKKNYNDIMKKIKKEKTIKHNKHYISIYNMN